MVMSELKDRGWIEFKQADKREGLPGTGKTLAKIKDAGEGIGKVWPLGQSGRLCFCKSSLIGTRPCSFMHVLSLAAFMLYQ